jgi:hypothetical protein
MRRWTIPMMFATAFAADVQSQQQPEIPAWVWANVNACVPTFEPEFLRRVNVATQRCRMRLQSYLYEASGELKGNLSIGFDANDALRIAQNDSEEPFTLTFENPVIHAGRDDDTIYWGIWSGRGMLGYLAGSPSRALPTGVRTYGLVGSPHIVSSGKFGNAPDPHADYLGNRVAPGPISRADLRVDFDAGTATLNLHFTVRGAGTHTVIALKRRTLPSQEFEEADCEDSLTCSTASLKFYGEGATHAGILLTVHYDKVMGEAGTVPAKLTNVRGQAAIGLRQR